MEFGVPVGKRVKMKTIPIAKYCTGRDIHIHVPFNMSLVQLIKSY